MDWKFLFLTAEGRIGQRDFWLSALVLIGATMIIAVVPGLNLLLPLVGLVLLWPWICVFTKRLHDFGKSGWLQVVPLGVGMVLSMIGAAMTGFSALAAGNAAGGGLALGAGLMVAGLLSLLAAVINIGFLLWVGLTKGDAGANKFGEPQTISAFNTPAAPTTGTVAPPATTTTPAETTTTSVQPNPPSDTI